MTRFQPLWQQAGNYPSQLDRYLIGSLWPGGGVLGGAVTAVANTMQVSVAPGSAAVPLQAGQGAALCHWDAPEVLTLDASPPSGQSRVDLIVCQVRDPDLDGGLSSDFVIQTVKGTPATMADTRPGDKEGDELEGVGPEQQAATPALPVNALALAEVTVSGAAANLNTATVKDRRGGMALTAYQVRVVASDYNLPTNAEIILPCYGRVQYDPYKCWENSITPQNGYRVPVDGWYDLRMGILVGMGANTNGVWCGFKVNGVTAMRAPEAWNTWAQTWAHSGTTVADVLPLKAGDLVQPLGYASDGQWITYPNQASSPNYVAIRRVA